MAIMGTLMLYLEFVNVFISLQAGSGACPRDAAGAARRHQLDCQPSEIHTRLECDGHPTIAASDHAVLGGVILLIALRWPSSYRWTV